MAQDNGFNSLAQTHTSIKSFSRLWGIVHTDAIKAQECGAPLGLWRDGGCQEVPEFEAESNRGQMGKAPQCD